MFTNGAEDTMVIIRNNQQQNAATLLVKKLLCNQDVPDIEKKPDPKTNKARTDTWLTSVQNKTCFRDCGKELLKGP
jgi:hypothetical protein